MNIELKPITVEDTPIIIKWRNSEAVMHNFIDRRPLTEETHNYWLETKVKSGDVVQFVCVDKDNNTPFASTYLRDINRNHKKAEFGIFIGEEKYRGKGIGEIITRETVNYAFTHLDLNKVYARVLSFNLASYKTFKKLGFFEDACLRSDVIIEGKEYDVFILSMLKKDWSIR